MSKMEPPCRETGSRGQIAGGTLNRPSLMKLCPHPRGQTFLQTPRQEGVFCRENRIHGWPGGGEGRPRKSAGREAEPGNG